MLSQWLLEGKIGGDGAGASSDGDRVSGTEFRGQSFRDRGPCSSDATVIRAPSPLLDRGEHLKL